MSGKVVLCFCLASSCALVLGGAVTSRPGLRPVEDFTVRPIVAPFKLSEQKGKFVALHFLLKTECPYCIRHTHEYASRAAELPNVVQVFLKPDPEAEVLRWMSSYNRSGGALPVIYRDPDATLARRFGIPDGYRFHNENVHYPALVLIDPQGQEVFRYVGKNNTDRFSFDQLKAKIKELAP